MSVNKSKVRTLVQTTLKAVDYFLWIYKLPFKTANFVMLHTHRHGSALQTSLFLNLVNLEEKLMQGKNITGWAVAQTCCISQCAKYRKSGIFGYRWEQNP